MAEGGSLLPMPAQEVHMKVFQGGGTSSLLEIPEVAIPMQVYKGGAFDSLDDNFSVENIVEDTNITFRGLTVKEVIEALSSVSTKTDLPILILYKEKGDNIHPLVKTQVIVKNIPFTLTTGSFKIENNKIKYSGKNILELEKLYFYDPHDGIELKGDDFLFKDIFFFLYRENAPSENYTNNIFELFENIPETKSETLENSQPIQTSVKNKKVEEGVIEQSVIEKSSKGQSVIEQGAKGKGAIEQIEKRIRESKREESKLLSNIFQEKMGGEREANIISMYLLRDDGKNLERNIEELLDYLERVKKPVSFLTFNGHKGSFPPSTPLFQKALQWHLQRRTNSLLEKLLQKKGVQNMKEEQKVSLPEDSIKEEKKEESIVSPITPQISEQEEQKEQEEKKEESIVTPITLENPIQEEQKVIVQDTGKIMEEIQKQSLGKETGEKTGEDLYTLLTKKLEKFESRSREAAKNRILGRQAEFIKVPKNLKYFLNKVDKNTQKNLYYAYEKDFIEIPFDDIKVDADLQNIFQKNIEDANKIGEWYDENFLLILFWKVYITWIKKTYEGSAVEDDWKYTEFNNFISNILLLTNKFKVEVSQFITSKTIENPLQTNPDFTVENKLNLSIDLFSIHELFYRIFHIEFNTKNIEKVLKGGDNWILIGWIDTPGESEFEKIQYKGCKANLQTLYQMFSKNEDEKKKYIDYTNELFAESVNSNSEKNTATKVQAVAWANQQQPIKQPETQLQKRGRGRPNVSPPPVPPRSQSAATGGSRRVKRHITKTKKQKKTIDGVRGRVRKSRRARSQ